MSFRSARRWECDSMFSLHYFVIVLCMFCLASCRDTPGSALKIQNATMSEIRIKSVSVNGIEKSNEQFVLSAGTAQKYSPHGHVEGVSLRGREKLEITVVDDGGAKSMSCVIKPDLVAEVCLVKATYIGDFGISCGYDCEKY